MPKMLVIADDLSGAADCVAACAAQGLRASVLLTRAGDLSRLADVSDIDILSIDADTRCLSPQQAADTTAAVVRGCQSRAAVAGDRLLFKKLDSTLRGNMATELAAALHVRRGLAGIGEKISILLAPALPAHGRTTVNGRQLVLGLPMEQAGSWPGEPVSPRSELSSSLAEVGLQCGLIPLDMVRAGSNRLRNTMLCTASEVDVVICDAETDDDLRRIANASMVLDARTVWAGSAGLAWHLPHAAGLSGKSASVPYAQLAPGPTLFVVGSLSEVSREQAHVLASHPGVTSIEVPHQLLLANHAASERARLAERVCSILESGMDALLLIDSSERCAPGKAQLLTRALARMLEPCASRAGALTATGGETARAILDAWGVRRLRLLGEVESGLPFSVAEEWDRPLPILTKAGGFGTPATLLYCREFLHKMDRNPALRAVSTQHHCRKS